LTQEYILIHALSFLTKDVRPIRRILGRTRCVGISRGIAFEHRCLVSQSENGRRDGACTDETGTRRRGGRKWWRIYVMKRSPGWSRAWDARTHVPSSFPMRDACQDGENKERREQESLFLLEDL